MKREILALLLATTLIVVAAVPLISCTGKENNSAHTLTPTATPTPTPTPTNTPCINYDPNWKILVLIYQNTDFAFVDGSLQRRVVASMTLEEMGLASAAAQRFFKEDVPQLDNGYMQPTVTIRYPQRTLDQLDPDWGYWPSRANTAPELDPAFDSVVVIWESAGVDINNSNQSYNLANACGLTPSNGTGQTYTAIPVFCIASNNRNVFKHEWGHSILFYFAAAGTASSPAVDNHINNNSNQYVHCQTGESYILQDETDDNPIPNSIYNNQQGFTHDYYSGPAARPGATTQCLGITQIAWASGGPVSHSSNGDCMATPTPTP
jgi:hypothetical protein